MRFRLIENGVEVKDGTNLLSFSSEFRPSSGDVIATLGGTEFRVLKSPLTFSQYRGPTGPEYQVRLQVEAVVSK